MKLPFTILYIFFYLNCFSQNDSLYNDGIIKMFKSGISKEIILKKITTSANNNFDLSADGLVYLKTNKIPDTVIITMFDYNNVNSKQTFINSKVDEPIPIKINKKLPNQENILNFNDLVNEGIYYYNDEEKEFIALPLSTTTNMQSNLGLSLAGVDNTEFVFMNDRSIFAINDNQPVFYIKLENTSLRNTLQIQPAQMVLYKSIVKNGVRKVPFQKSIFGVRSNKNKNVVFPILTRIDNTTYKISFEKKIPKGSYFIAPNDGLNTNCFEFDIFN